MARYFIYLSFDGTAYHGWQRQPNGTTVQELLEGALSTLLRHPTPVTGAGRTDAGVNASMMVAHFDVEQPIETTQLHYKLNRLLPPDVAVQQIRPVREDAHARFDATSRTYRYYVTTTKEPFRRTYSYRVETPLDFEAMNKAASLLFRYTDFTSFSKLHTDTKTNNCLVWQAVWEQLSPTEWVFIITADRFLRNMVRAIVGTLLQVGRGRLSIEEFAQVIEHKARAEAGDSVPGCALFLSQVTYPQDIFLSDEP